MGLSSTQDIHMKDFSYSKKRQEKQKEEEGISTLNYYIYIIKSSL